MVTPFIISFVVSLLRCPNPAFRWMVFHQLPNIFRWSVRDDHKLRVVITFETKRASQMLDLLSLCGCVVLVEVPEPMFIA